MVFLWCFSDKFRIGEDKEAKRADYRFSHDRALSLREVDGRNSSTRRIRLRIYSQSSRLSTTGLWSGERLLLTGVNVAGDVAVTRIEWITRARNDAAVADGRVPRR